jgi:hypothetical protein
MTLAEWCLANVVTTKEEIAKTPKPRLNAYSKRAEVAAVDMICHCGAYYTTTRKNLKRGWGLSCCRKCAARRVKFFLPPGKRVKK